MPFGVYRYLIKCIVVCFRSFGMYQEYVFCKVILCFSPLDGATDGPASTW